MAYALFGMLLERILSYLKVSLSLTMLATPLQIACFTSRFLIMWIQMVNSIGSNFKASPLLTILVKISSVTPPSVLMIADSPLSSLGIFTVKSAYSLIANNHLVGNHSCWKLILKWGGLQRVRTFLWLTLHNRILTNRKRMRRHLCPSAICEIGWIDFEVPSSDGG